MSFTVGTLVGGWLGTWVGKMVGSRVGEELGTEEGAKVLGARVGVPMGIKLGADVQKRITDDRTLGLTPGRVDNVICSLASLDGDRFGMNTTGIAIVQIDVAFQSDSGV